MLNTLLLGRISFWFNAIVVNVVKLLSDEFHVLLHSIGWLNVCLIDHFLKFIMKSPMLFANRFKIQRFNFLREFTVLLSLLVWRLAFDWLSIKEWTEKLGNGHLSDNLFQFFCWRLFSQNYINSIGKHFHTLKNLLKLHF